MRRAEASHHRGGKVGVFGSGRQMFANSFGRARRGAKGVMRVCCVRAALSAALAVVLALALALALIPVLVQAVTLALPLALALVLLWR